MTQLEQQIAREGTMSSRWFDKVLVVAGLKCPCGGWRTHRFVQARGHWWLDGAMSASDGAYVDYCDRCGREWDNA